MLTVASICASHVQSVCLEGLYTAEVESSHRAKPHSMIPWSTIRCIMQKTDESNCSHNALGAEAAYDK